MQGKSSQRTAIVRGNRGTDPRVEQGANRIGLGLVLRFLSSAIVGGLFLPFPGLSQADAPIPLDLERSQPFWDTAARLTQDQIEVLSRVEDAFATPDPNRVRAVRGQVLLHLGQLDRFLGRVDQGEFGRSNLGNCGAVFRDEVDPSTPQDRVACELKGAIADWEALLPLFDSRLSMLSTIAEVKPLPLVSGESVLGRGGIPGFERGSLRSPALSLNAPQPAIEYMPLPLGRPVKSALSDYQAPLDPAVAPLGAGIGQVARLYSRWDALTQNFPTALQNFTDPRSPANPPMDPSMSSTIVPRLDPALQDYEDLLAEPHTGIATLRPPVARSGVIRNRLAPDPSPFVPLLPADAQGFQPYLKLQVNTSTAKSDRLEMVFADLDYGFVAAIGNVPLAELSAELAHPDLTLAPDAREFFLGYRPPQTLAALQVDRRRFLTGKQAAFISLDTPLRGEVPLSVGQTYLMRSVQFAVPDTLRNRPLTPDARRYLDQRLPFPARDLLVVVRPVSQRSDGSYVAVWRVLQEFPHPRSR